MCANHSALNMLDTASFGSYIQKASGHSSALAMLGTLPGSLLRMYLGRSVKPMCIFLMNIHTSGDIYYVIIVSVFMSDFCVYLYIFC